MKYNHSEQIITVNALLNHHIRDLSKKMQYSLEEETGLIMHQSMN